MNDGLEKKQRVAWNFPSLSPSIYTWNQYVQRQDLWQQKTQEFFEDIRLLAIFKLIQVRFSR